MFILDYGLLIFSGDYMVNLNIAGSQGAQGAAGSQGAAGAQGAQGAAGSIGSDGPQGAQGAQGLQGAQGTQGVQGSQGLAGNVNVDYTYVATMGDSSVSLLLHMEGANNSTTFTDKSYSPKTVTAYGNAKISTAASKFGGSSAAFDGNGDYIEFDRGADLQFGAGDFTIEGWVNLNSLATYQSVFGGYDIGFDIQNSTTIVVGYNAMGGGFMSRTVSTISTGTWYHWAMSKTAGTFRLFWNGVQQGASAVAPTMNNTVAKWVIGKNATNNSSHHLNGYVDEVRVTKGLGRYTSNFTPSTSAFANADGSDQLSANATAVGDTIYSSDGIYACSSTSPLTWKKYASTPTTIIF